MKFKGLTGLVLGTGLALVGCDSYSNLVLDEIEIKGDVKVKLIQEVLSAGSDKYRLEVYDEDGNLRVTFISRDLYNGTKLVHDNGKVYTVKDGKRFYEQEKDFKFYKQKETDSEKKDSGKED